MMFDKKFLYKFTFPNGMVYIGSSKNIKRRWAASGAAYRNMRVGEAIEEFGWENIKKEVLLELDGSIRGHDIVGKMERELIKAYGEKAYNEVCSDVFHKKRAVNNSIRYKPKRKWTINGVTKPAIEWCEEFGKTYSGTLKRIENYNLTPEQALTFPTVPNGQRRDAIGYWRKCGLLKETEVA